MCYETGSLALTLLVYALLQVLPGELGARLQPREQRRGQRQRSLLRHHQAALSRLPQLSDHGRQPAGRLQLVLVAPVAQKPTCKYNQHCCRRHSDDSSDVQTCS